jgi:3-dehydroquinate synthase
MIYDLDFFNWCEEQIAPMRTLEQEQIVYAIRRSCEVKAEVVSQDERESGLRAILNFGHTFGHAIESGMGYGQWLHGEAVGCGMIMAAELSALVCGLPAQDVARIKALVQASGCPITPPQWPADRWLELMQVDKKNEGGQLRFVLLDKLGHAKVQAVAPDVVRQALARFTTVEQE